MTTIFLAGGSGILGRQLIPRLVLAGHDVVATTRHPGKAYLLEALGAHPVVIDVFDADDLAEAVAAAAPDLVMHQLTDLSEYDTDANARLRREGTANLVAAARTAGVDRMIVQSIAWAFPPGGRPATERDPIVPDTAVDIMERLVHRLPHATVLRYGMLYGRGTWYAPGGRIARLVEHRALPATTAITNFVHLDDAVNATIQSLTWPDGTYHIVDDEPAPATTWLPIYAAQIGAREPLRGELPDGAQIGRPVSNAKARAHGWRPGYPSWREGFAHQS